MPRQTRALVIGGGIMGAGVLYGLAANGWTDVVLCEKGELTSGSTWHAAGLIAHAVGSRNMAWINNYSLQLYKRLEKETGQSVSWHECGALRIGYTDDEVDWFQSILSVGKSLDFPMDIIGPEEIARANPYFNVAGVKAAIRTYRDGHIDPSGATQVLAAGARKLGATIERYNRVTGVTPQKDGWLVHCEKGDILAEHIVIAAGGYANQVGRWFGITVPSLSVLHQYFVTDPVPEFVASQTEIPVTRDNSYGGYIRQEQKSGLIGVYEDTNCTAIWEDGVPWETENALFDADYDGVAKLLERAFDRRPILAKQGIRRVVRGAITHTPDGGLLVGPAPGVRNVWLACGASIGIAWGGGAGKCLADWMVHGETAISTRALDPRRFGPYATPNYILVKTKEDYEVRHDTPTPGYNRKAGRPWRTTPVFEKQKAKGAVFGEVHGWERPRWFANTPGVTDSNGWRRQPWFEAVGRECKAVRERAGFIDLTAFSQFFVSGRDAGSFLDRLSANRPPKRIGGVCLAHLLTDRGYFETEVTISRLTDERFFLGSAIAGERKDVDWLSFHVRPDEDVRIQNISSDWGFLALSGPRARDILNRGTKADLSSAAFPWMSARETDVFGVPCILLRVGFTGELGWELHMPLDQMLRVYDGLSEAGASYGLVEFGSHALNSLRMEKAYRGGADLSSEVGLPEADMMRFFKSDNRNFIGREATLERVAKGIAWKLAYVALRDSEADCTGGEAVFHNGRYVGLVSSGGYGYATGTSLAFAYVGPEAARPGERLEIMLLGKTVSADVLAEPIYDPMSERLRM